ncbi:MAG: tetratricopeptide repeat protein [Planctomycetota bacterium]
MTPPEEISPYLAARLLREAEGYAELGLPEDALARVERVLDAGRYRSPALGVKAEILRSLGRYAEAAPLLREICDAEPSNVPARLALGWCLKRTHDIAGAIAALQEAREASPDDALVIYNLACYKALAGLRDEALDLLREAIAREASYREQARSESDFASLRDDPEFRELTAPESASEP